MFLHKMLAFIRKDFQIESSYKLNFAMRSASSVIPLFLFYFMSQWVTPRSEFAGSSEDIFDYLIIGLAFTRYFQLALRKFSDSIRNAQMTGCLESMLSSQTNPETLVVFSSLYSLLSATLQLLLVIGTAVVVFGFNVGQANIGAAIVIFLLSVLTYTGFGILAAASIIWLKRGDFITWIFTGLFAILGGAFFPVEVMWGWLQTLAAMIPLKYSFDGLRATILEGQSLSQLGQPILVLSIWAAVMLPLSLKTFSLFVARGRRDGTLMQY